MVKKSKKTVKKKIVPKKKTTQQSKKIVKKTNKVNKKGIDYSGAMNKPFSNRNIALIGILIFLVTNLLDSQLWGLPRNTVALFSFVSILIWIFMSGYGVEVINLELKGKEKLPKWDNLLQKFINGIKVVVINIAYLTLPIILAVLLVYRGLTPLLSGVVEIDVVLSLLIANAWFIFGILLLTLFLSYYLLGAEANFAKKMKLVDGFNFKEINERIFRWSFFKSILIMFLIVTTIAFTLAVIGLILSVVFSMIQSYAIVWNTLIINSILFSVLSWFFLVFTNTIVARAYKQ